MTGQNKTVTKEIWRNSDNFIKRALSFYFHTLAGGIIFWIALMLLLAVLSIIFSLFSYLG